MYLKGLSGDNVTISAKDAADIKSLILRAMVKEQRKGYDISTIHLLKDGVEFDHNASAEAVKGYGKIELRTDTPFNEFMPTKPGYHIFNKMVDDLDAEELEAAINLRGLKRGTEDEMRNALHSYADREYEVRACLDMRREDGILYYLLQFEFVLMDESKYNWIHEENCECTKLISKMLKEKKFLQACLVELHGRFEVPQEDFSSIGDLVGRTTTAIEARNARVIELEAMCNQLRSENKALKEENERLKNEITIKDQKIARLEAGQSVSVQEEQRAKPQKEALKLARAIAYHRLRLKNLNLNYINSLRTKLLRLTAQLKNLGFSEALVMREDNVRAAESMLQADQQKEASHREKKKKRRLENKENSNPKRCNDISEPQVVNGNVNDFPDNLLDNLLEY